MKPDWKDAPEWANWLALDANGDWFWHEDKPEWLEDEWWSSKRHTKAGYNCPVTLEPRP